MKILLIKIGLFLLNCVYFFFKLLPIDNKITFISRQSNVKSVDFVLIEKSIREKDKDVELVFLCKKLEKRYGSIIKYFFHMFRQMYHLATSKVIVLDSYCITACVLKKKKGTVIVQMWHALGAFKKFGRSILDKEEGTKKDLALTMKMHENYDYIFTSSEYTKKYFSEALNTKKENSVVMPLPRVDLLTDKNRISDIKEKIFKKYPSLKKKKNIVYAPTFRKEGEDVLKIKELIDSVNYKKYNLIVKLHPLTKIGLDSKNAIFDKEFSTLDMLYCADIVITDYSAIVYEAALLKKPMFFYCYDFDKYYKKRNFYLDYEKDMPGVIESDCKKLLNEIEHFKFDEKKLEVFTKKYIDYEDGKCSENVSDFILSKAVVKESDNNKFVYKMFKLYKKNKSVVNYLIAGGLTTVVNILSYALFRNFMDYILATILAWIAAVIFAYVINRGFVFESKDKKVLNELFKFVSCRLVTLGLEVLCMYILVDLISLNDMFSKIIVQFIVIVLNYFLSKIFVFRKKEDK